MNSYARTRTDVVTITGVDNKADAANKTVTVSGVISSGSATAPSGVTLTITDDDTKGVTVDPTSLTLVEGGTDGTYAVNLNSQPLADVTVTPKSSDMSSVAVSGALTFTSSNWSEAQTVTVTAVSDTDMDNETVTITNAVAGDDTGYVGVTAASVSVSVRDDESANKAPIFTEGESTTRSVNENTAAGENVGAAVTAEGDDEDTLTYALNGADAGSFDFDTSTGQIAVKDALDHETKASYSLTVTVHDGKNSAGDADTGVDDYIAVTVSVVNVDEPGSVSFDSETPIVGTALEAIITDPDGNVRDVAYTWQSSADRNDWEHISGSLATYTPSAADMGKYLRVTASYADGPGGHEIRLARAETANPVRLPPDNNEP